MAQDIMNANHIVAESTNILSTHFGGGHIYSIAIAEDMDNGLLVARAAYASDEYEDEVWEAKEYAAGDEALFILTPPTMGLIETKAGKILSCRILEQDDLEEYYHDSDY